MNLRKILYAVAFSIFIIGNIGFAGTNKYYCPDKGLSYNFYSINDVYEIDSNCERWKDEFWQKHIPESYKQCLKNRAVLEQRFKNGYCDPITEENYQIGDSSCTFEVSKKHKRIIMTTCSGTNTEAVKREFKSKYMY